MSPVANSLRIRSDQSSLSFPLLQPANETKSSKSVPFRLEEENYIDFAAIRQPQLEQHAIIEEGGTLTNYENR
jgi:hypothetical protein